MVVDIEPVADVEAIAMDSEPLALGAAMDHAGDELFRVLVGAIVVGAMGNGCGEAVGDGPGADEVVGSCFRGGVGGVRAVDGEFGEKAVFDRTIDFIRRDVVEVDVGQAADDLKEGEGASDIGLEEELGVGDAAVDVAFGGAVDDGVDVVFFTEGLYEGLIADIALDKVVAGIVGDLGQVIDIAGVGEDIEIDDGLEIWKILEAVADKS